MTKGKRAGKSPGKNPDPAEALTGGFEGVSSDLAGSGEDRRASSFAGSGEDR